MIPTHTKKPTPVIAYKFEGLATGSADYKEKHERKIINKENN